MGKESPKVLLYSPYGILDPNKHSAGVNNLLLETASHLKLKGFETVFVGPKMEDSVADYNLGKAINIPSLLAHLLQTQYSYAMPFSKWDATRLILLKQPDFVFIEEPLQGWGGHSIMSGVPQDENSRVVPVTLARFHARTEQFQRLAKLYLYLLNDIRRPKLNRHKLPNGKLSAGPLNTIFAHLDGKIAVSQATADYWNKYRPGEYRVIYNGIATDKLTPRGPKKEEWLLDSKKTIFFTGRHDLRKGVKYLLLAFERLHRVNSDIKLKIAGSGVETKGLKNMVKKLNLPDVEFLGVLSREELIRAYRTADVFVSPAIGGEGFGRTIAEAMACGTVTVASDIDGYREVMKGAPLGFLAKPKNPEDLAFRIKDALELAKKNKTYASEGHLYVVRRFSWEVVAKALVKYMEELYDRHGGVDWTGIKERYANRLKLSPSGNIFVARK